MSTSPSQQATSGRPAGLFTWIAVGIVLVVVAALVVVKVTSGSASSKSGTDSPTSSATLSQLTTIPASVFNTVGVTSGAAPVAKPIAIKNQPVETGLSSTGKKVPNVLYIGAEYCPFCAAQRWATIVALSRFGTWSGLQNTASSSIDSYPNTPSFTFLTAKFSSPYLSFQGIEQYGNKPDPATQGYYPLMKTPKAANHDFLKYDTPAFVPGMSVQNEYSYPFMSLANQTLISGSQFTPGLLANLRRDSIAAQLSTPSSPVTQAIIASANYLTASLCKLTKQQPAAVCTSPGVRLAAKGL